MKRKITIAIPAVMLGALLLALPAWAQRGFGAKAAPSGHAASGRSFSAGGAYRFASPSRSSLRFRGSNRGYGLGWGYLPYPEDYSQDAYQPAMFAPQPPPVFEAPEPPKIIQPILIERQGNEWVQVSGYKEATVSGHPEPTNSLDSTRLRSESPGDQESAEPARIVPPAILVFLDGHQEQVKSYTIIGGTIIAKTDYWSSGAWTRKIELANLDVPATLKLNEQQGTQFRLPSNPNEIVIRP
jgi:hypothetical protein